MTSESRKAKRSKRGNISLSALILSFLTLSISDFYKRAKIAAHKKILHGQDFFFDISDALQLPLDRSILRFEEI